MQIECALFFSVSAYFSFERKLDENLVQANEIIGKIFKEIKDPNSETSHKLIQEVHDNKYQGADELSCNLIHFEDALREDNERKTFFGWLESISRIFAAVIYAFKSYRGYSIEIKNHTLIPGDSWIEFYNIKDKAFHPTAKELNDLPYSIGIVGENSRQIKSEIAALLLELKRSISFTHGDHTYQMEYEKKKDVLTLSLSEAESKVKKNIFSPVMEKVLNGKATDLDFPGRGPGASQVTLEPGNVSEELQGIIEKVIVRYPIAIEVKGVDGTCTVETLTAKYEISQLIFINSVWKRGPERIILKEGSTYSLTGGSAAPITLTIKKNPIIQA